jgi:hypothetical protein
MYVTPGFKRRVVKVWLECKLPMHRFDDYTDLGEMSGIAYHRYISDKAYKRIELLLGPHGKTLAKAWIEKYPRSNKSRLQIKHET